MICIKDIVDYFESIAPAALQESYDNAGLLVGNPQAVINDILVAIDVTEAVVEEALQKNCNLIVAHHPVIFSGIKKLTGKNYVERVIVKAIQNDIAIFAAHTNLDTVHGGVNAKICEKLELTNTSVLQPVSHQLNKLVTFIPFDAADKVRDAVFEAGAGHIGNYDRCGYSIEGTGSFRGNDDTNPYVGIKGQTHFEKEIRFETIFPVWAKDKVIRALIESHPYEEVAYDIYPLENEFDMMGAGMTGFLQNPMTEMEFLDVLKQTFGSGCIKYTTLLGKEVNKIAVCGGSGSFLLNRAIAAKADFFVSADFKYHQFFDAEDKIVIADIGHFESEQFTKEIFYEALVKKFPKFAVRISEVNTNPVNYFSGI